MVPAQRRGDRRGSFVRRPWRAPRATRALVVPRPRSTLARLALAILAFALVSLAATPSPAQLGGGGYAWGDPEWRFTLRGRRVKVVLLAGSIGAFRDGPYARHLHEWCDDAEIRNLSHVGWGASQLYGSLRRDVLENPRVPFGSDGVELWLMWNGGMNSARNGYRTNHYIRRAFRDAHRRGMRVVGLTLTPWGTLEDERRWGGVAGLRTHEHTRRIVDFVMGRLSPRAALGTYAELREVPSDAPWDPSERADVAIDLFDSPLRDRDARLRDIEAMTRAVSRDSRWARDAAGLDDAARAARLARDARALAELPRWFMRDEFRGFDDVHPNAAGHLAIASAVCPRLPASWGCRCP